MKAVGILGGLGPSTTSRLYLDIVNYEELRKYPNILISNVSFPRGMDEQIIQNKKGIDSIINPLIESINQLKGGGVDIFVLPCNTLEDLAPEIKNRTGVTLLTPVGEVVEMISKIKIKKLGVIATSKTRELGAYGNRLKNIEILYPSEKNQKEVSHIIGRIITNKTRRKDGIFLGKLIVEFKELGCDRVILGCTDLSDIVKESSFIIDSFSVLSEKIKNILLDN